MNYLRISIYAHLVWVILVGAMARGAFDRIFETIARLVPSIIFDLAFCLVPFLGFPLLVIVLVCKVPMSGSKRAIVLLIDAGLFVASMIAIIPAIQ